MLGNAVRLAPLLLQEEKEYICLARLHGDVPPEQVQCVAKEFTGGFTSARRSGVLLPVPSGSGRFMRLEILDVEGRLC